MEVPRLRRGLSPLSALVCLLGQEWGRRGEQEVPPSLSSDWAGTGREALR